MGIAWVAVRVLITRVKMKEQWISRIIGGGGLLIGVTAIGMMLETRQEQERLEDELHTLREGIEVTIQNVREEQEKNLFGDCVLQRALLPKYERANFSLDECKKQRNTWWNNHNKRGSEK